MIQTKSYRWSFLPFVIATALVSALAPAFAEEGAIELNHTCATTTGCLPGDAPGYPIRLGGPGSYVLTSDLDLPDENTTGILIAWSSVSIDLAGFAIRAPGIAGTGIGIDTLGNADTRARVFGGSIVGVGDAGLVLQRFAFVSDVHVRNVGGDGIHCSNHSIVRNSRVDDAGADGINMAAGGLVIDSESYGAGSEGIRTVGNSLVADSTISGATERGIAGNGHSGIADNYVAENNGGGTAQQISGFWFDLGGNFCGLSTPTVCP